MINQPSRVLEVAVVQNGKMHVAYYFLERDVLHAMIGGRLVTAALFAGDAADCVTDMLLLHLLQVPRTDLPHARLVAMQPPTPSADIRIAS